MFLTLVTRDKVGRQHLSIFLDKDRGVRFARLNASNGGTLVKARALDCTCGQCQNDLNSASQSGFYDKVKTLVKVATRCRLVPVNLAT